MGASSKDKKLELYELNLVNNVFFEFNINISG